ncbi:MAG: sigma-70 family RNA polymerase sigma factor [Planctomycetota bacterium]
MTDTRDPAFYLAHASYVRTLARRLVYDPHAADDLFQAAWLAALQRPARDLSVPRRWLAGIVRKLAAKSWLGTHRRRQRERLMAPPPPVSRPEDVLAHEHERRRVVQALLALEEPYRSTLIARFFDGLEPAQIAARDGVPLETVRTRQKRGLQRLRERLLERPTLALALVSGLRLGAPDVRGGLIKLGNGVMAVNSAKKAGIVLALAALVAFGWWSWLPAQPGAGGAGGPAGIATAAPPAMPSPSAAAVGSREAAPPAAPDTRPAAAAASPSTGTLVVHVDWSDHRPAAGIGVTVGRLGAPNFEVAAVRGHTGTDGIATFDRITAGETRVELDRRVHAQVAVADGQRTALTLVIPAGVHVRGHVLDLDGGPAAGASVSMLTSGFESGARIVARTAADGTFAIDDAPPATPIALSACAPMRAPTAQMVVSGEAGANVDVELRFVAHGGAVTGRIVDGDGAPIAAAIALVGYEGYSYAERLGRGEAPPLRSRRGDADGHGDWLVDTVAAGDTPVIVVADGYASWQGRVSVVEGGTVRCDAMLERAVQLRGTVSDEGGEPVPGATVRHGQWGLTSVATATDEHGDFTLGGLPVGTIAVEARAEGRGEARAEFVGAAGAELTWNAVLSRARTLRGRVLMADQPVAGARVQARCMPSALRMWFGEATSGADGRFELTNCPSALLHLGLQTPDGGQFLVGALDDVDPTGGEVTLLVDTARLPTAVAAGRVVDEDGDPVQGAEVTVLPTSSDWGGGHVVRTDEEGRFRSPGCPPGDWYLTVRAAGHAWRGSSCLALVSGQVTDFGDLAVARGGSVVLTLAPDAGVDIEGLVVTIGDANRSFDQQRPKNGVVRFDGVGPGDHVVVAYAGGVAQRRIAIHVGNGPETAHSLPLTAGSQVRVDVLDENGQAIVDRVETQLCDAAGICFDRTPLTPAASPMQWQRRLAAGRYELRLTDHRGHSVAVPIVVTAGGQPVDLTARLQ